MRGKEDKTSRFFLEHRVRLPPRKMPADVMADVSINLLRCMEKEFKFGTKNFTLLN
jgi:hypothetical protein